MRSSRPRQRVVATPRSIESGVIRGSSGRNSSAARTASAALRSLEIAGERRRRASTSRRWNGLPNIAARLPEDVEHARIVVRRQHDRAAMDDARFLAGDLANGRAEVLGVIETDRSDERGERADHVRRVETAAHADFEHHHLALRIGEGDEGEEGQSFEVRRHDAGAIGGGAQLLDRNLESRTSRSSTPPIIHRSRSSTRCGEV